MSNITQIEMTIAANFQTETGVVFTAEDIEPTGFTVYESGIIIDAIYENEAWLIETFTAGRRALISRHSGLDAATAGETLRNEVYAAYAA